MTPLSRREGCTKEHLASGGLGKIGISISSWRPEWQAKKVLETCFIRQQIHRGRQHGGQVFSPQACQSMAGRGIRMGLGLELDQKVPYSLSQESGD
jgi:hypothetical protein